MRKKIMKNRIQQLPGCRERIGRTFK
jgi:hypothetical protein